MIQFCHHKDHMYSKPQITHCGHISFVCDIALWMLGKPAQIVTCASKFVLLDYAAEI